MAMTTLIETDTGTRPVLVTTAAELGARSGGLLRALATGALVRVDDNRVKAEACLMVPPQLIPRVLEFCGIDPDTLPEPGTARDHLV
jgi:hypothetical protein